jgi:assimilatory nitrate reductase catalytic subunit
MATNPAVSMPDTTRVQEALQQCDYVVVSDCVADNETVQYADVRLPALTWGERDGTVTNSDRTISRQRPFLPPPGEARADWEIITGVAQKMGFGAAFPYQHSVDVFREHAGLSAYRNAGERCFNLGALADISRQDFDELKPVQWPLKKRVAEDRVDKVLTPTRRLFADGHFFTADGRANFITVQPRFPRSVATLEHPLVMNTGRVRDHWHTLTRTGMSGRLSGHTEEAYAEIHPVDAAERGVRNDALVRVFNGRGELCVRAKVSNNQQPGSIFVPMHWGRSFSSNAGVGGLIPPVTDELSGQPESKHAAVQIAPYPALWHGFILSRRRLEMGRAGYYWSLSRVADVWQYTLAAEKSSLSRDRFARELLCAADESVSWVEYLDNARQTYRAARFTGRQLESCIFIGMATEALPSAEWLVGLFGKEELSSDERRSLLTGQPGVASASVGKIVCACFNVGENTIRQAISEQELSSVEQIGQCLQAGTNCGSCVPELKALLAADRKG